MRTDWRLWISSVGWAKRSVPNIEAVRWARCALPNLQQQPRLAARLNQAEMPPGQGLRHPATRGTGEETLLDKIAA